MFFHIVLSLHSRYSKNQGGRVSNWLVRWEFYRTSFFSHYSPSHNILPCAQALVCNKNENDKSAKRQIISIIETQSERGIVHITECVDIHALQLSTKNLYCAYIPISCFVDITTPSHGSNSYDTHEWLIFKASTVITGIIILRWCDRSRCICLDSLTINYHCVARRNKDASIIIL